MDAGAQGTIAGTVTAAESGAPLAGAQVSVQGTTRRAATDAMGRYRISIEAGTYTVEATTLGRQRDQKQTSVTAGGTSTVNFALEITRPGVETTFVEAVTGQEGPSAEG